MSSWDKIYDEWENLERIWNDSTAWLFYNDSEIGEFGVYRRCPECGRYLKKGDVFTNLNGDIKLENWICKKHGKVEPYCEILDSD